MKKSFNFLLIAGFVGLVNFSCQNADATDTAATAESNNTKTVLAENKAAVDMKVEGMVCAMGCAKFIEDKVSKLEGVVLSQVDFEEESAHFEFDKTTTSAQDIEKYINNMHDGQYSAKIAATNADETSEENTVEKTKSDNDKKKVVGAVSESIDFKFPELFTYFLKRF